MARRRGFDTERYLEAQARAILERVARFGDKLYLEFGGKLLDDHHAARVLPGYDPDAKVQLLERLRERVELLFCVSALDLARGRIRGDFGMTYDLASLKTLDDLRDRGLAVRAVVINRYDGQEAADTFRRRLERRGVPVYTSRDIEGYPEDVDRICSPEGYGRNPYIETSRPIVAITGAGPGSGKMSTALKQMWHDQQRGINSGYAKWETFPVWDLPLDHPVNRAYEAATADLGDYNLIDPYHLEAYGVEAVNYNRDVVKFPILRAIMERQGAGVAYRSPTDMGVNRVSEGIVDDEAVREAARQELVRRYLRYRWEHAIGVGREETLRRAEELMRAAGMDVTDRPTVLPARRAAETAREAGKGYRGAYCGAALELPSGEVVTGRNSELLYSTSAALLNAVKRLAGIPDEQHVLSETVIRNLVRLKREVLGINEHSLDVGEALSALAVSAATNPAAERAFRTLPVLRHCEMHMTHVPTERDQVALRQLGVRFTTDARFTPGGYFLK